MKKYILMTILLVHSGGHASAFISEALFAPTIEISQESIRAILENVVSLNVSNYQETSRFDYSGKVIPGVNPAGTEARD